MLENIEKIVFDRKEPFFGKLETFLQHILEYRRIFFPGKKIICDRPGWTPFKTSWRETTELCSVNIKSHVCYIGGVWDKA